MHVAARGGTWRHELLLIPPGPGRCGNLTSVRRFNPRSADFRGHLVQSCTLFPSAAPDRTLAN